MSEINLKERIIKEMVLNDKDKLFKAIMEEYNFNPIRVEECLEKHIKIICEHCSRKGCCHKYHPYLSSDLNNVICVEKDIKRLWRNSLYLLRYFQGGKW